jgi:hypothetical protein
MYTVAVDNKEIRRDYRRVMPIKKREREKLNIADNS